MGKVLTAEDGEPAEMEEMLPNVVGRVPKVKFSAKTDQALFACLDETERVHLPDSQEILFCVISARRMNAPEGIKDCLTVQRQLSEAGATPRWFVDSPSLERYRQVGFQAVPDGGSLVGARNKALEAAGKEKKVCCQISDDIRCWHYYVVPQGLVVKTDEEANDAVRRCRRLAVSPVAAARFLVAKMRANNPKPRLGGLLPTDNIARSLGKHHTSLQSFILGDFFVAESSSAVRFDTSFSLKEDYDFTCQHILKHGAALRSNRMCLTAKHRVNAGGACSVRDSAEEQKNIATLRRKWPSVFRLHPTREDEVIMRWVNKGGA